MSLVLGSRTAHPVRSGLPEAARDRPGLGPIPRHVAGRPGWMAHPSPIGKGPAPARRVLGRLLAAASAAALPSVEPGRTGTAGVPRRAPAARSVGLAALSLAAIVLVGAGLGWLAAPPHGAAPSAVVAPSTAEFDSVVVGGGWPPPATTAPGLDPLDLGAKIALVGLLLYLALRLLRRFVAPVAAGNGPIAVLATRPLGPKVALHLVAVGERRLLVGESPAGLVGLTELAADELSEPLGSGDLEAATLEGVR